MKILDLDMDYFMKEIANDIPENCTERLEEEYYIESVWNKKEVINFLENNLGLSKEHKIKGRIVKGHNEALFFWRELIEKNILQKPFEVIHVDSHADLGLGTFGFSYVLNTLLPYDVSQRPKYGKGHEGIGDYLLFAIAYQWISKLTYCANPKLTDNDYPPSILKNFYENESNNQTIQLADITYSLRVRSQGMKKESREKCFKNAEKDPEVPMLIIKTIKEVKFDGNFDFAVMAQSPNYTPKNADYIMDIFKEYIEEI